MPLRLRSLASRVGRLIAHPGRAFRLITRRVVPISALLGDPEAYHVVGSWTYGRLPRVPATVLFPALAAADLTLIHSLERDADTSLTLLELAVLCGIVRVTNARRVLEIGTFDGGTALNLAANLPADGRVTTVDLPVDWSGSLALHVPTDAVNVTSRRTVATKYRDTVYEGRIRQVYGDSAQIDWATLGGPFDLIFVDGCHSYDYVLKDTANALAHLRPGGLLLWHDYGIIEDVSAAVDRTARGLRVEAIRSTSLAVGFAP